MPKSVFYPFLTSLLPILEKLSDEQCLKELRTNKEVGCVAYSIHVLNKADLYSSSFTLNLRTGIVFSCLQFPAGGAKVRPTDR